MTSVTPNSLACPSALGLGIRRRGLNGVCPWSAVDSGCHSSCKKAAALRLGGSSSPHPTQPPPSPPPTRINPGAVAAPTASFQWVLAMTHREVGSGERMGGWRASAFIYPGQVRLGLQHELPAHCPHPPSPSQFPRKWGRGGSSQEGVAPKAQPAPVLRGWGRVWGLVLGACSSP